MKESMLKITLKKNEDRRVKAGHPWVFSNEIALLDGLCESGVAAELFDAGGSFVGSGFYNPHSLIAFRLISHRREDLDNSGFFVQRLSAALTHRRSELERAWLPSPAKIEDAVRQTLAFRR